MIFAPFELQLGPARVRLLHIAAEDQSDDFSHHWQKLTGIQISHSHLPSGRPVLSGFAGDISLSHTSVRNGAQVLLLGAVSAPAKIGVDVELEGRKITNPFTARMDAINPNADPILIWTLLEAHSKCFDLPIFFDQVQLMPGPLHSDVQRWTCFSPHFNGRYAHAWTCTQNGFHLAVAVECEQRQLTEKF
jgi:hypothetical protein